MPVYPAGSASLHTQLALALCAANSRLDCLDWVILVGHSWVFLLEFIVLEGAHSTEVICGIILGYLWEYCLIASLFSRDPFLHQDSGVSWHVVVLELFQKISQHRSYFVDWVSLVYCVIGFINHVNEMPR